MCSGNAPQGARALAKVRIVAWNTYRNKNFKNACLEAKTKPAVQMESNIITGLEVVKSATAEAGQRSDRTMI